MIILADNISDVLLTLSKIATCCIIVAAAFQFGRLRRYLITVFIFIFSNYLTLGIVVGAFFLFRSDKIVVRNSAVYFDISARGLLFSAFVAYVISALIIRIRSRILSKNEVYTLTVVNNGAEVTFIAMSDTGNKLREPFSDAPVIVVDRERAQPLLCETGTRLVPVSTVSGTSLLLSFKPEKMILKTSKGEEMIDHAYIALSDDVNSDMYSAILNPEILSV